MHACGSIVVLKPYKSKDAILGYFILENLSKRGWFHSRIFAQGNFCPRAYSPLEKLPEGALVQWHQHHMESMMLIIRQGIKEQLIAMKQELLWKERLQMRSLIVKKLEATSVPEERPRDRSSTHPPPPQRRGENKLFDARSVLSEALPAVEKAKLVLELRRRWKANFWEVITY